MNNLSWENPPYADEYYEEFCEKSTPADFYFDVKGNLELCGGLTIIAIVPKLYFNKNGYMWDQHMMIDCILPDDFFEAMESVWETERDVEEVRQDLLARGFEENEDFSKMVGKSFE